jgi:hypothetical protein
MIKILDIDKLFDKYIESYVYSNIGKIKPEEIENNIPVLYVKFGNESLKELDGKTPNEYYKNFTAEELLGALKEHLEKNVSVSDFLCEALTFNPKNADAIAKELSADNDEQFTLYLMNMLEEMNADIPTERFLDFVILDYSEPIKELASEMLQRKSDKVKSTILKEYENVSDKTKTYLVEILSYAKLKEDKIFDILIKEFVSHPKEIPFYVNLLARYGDERAVPFIKTVIEDDKISYADFEELRFALEVFGEVYDKERDFSKDKFYNKIKEKRARNTQKS